VVNVSTLGRYLGFNFPPSQAISTLDDHIYSTQLLQSEALSTAYRSWKREWKGEGREYCGGLLVWQLNDCWPVTSWAIADYHQRPKMAFWAVKRESELITTGIKRNDTSFEAWGVNLTLERKIVDVRIKAWDVRSGETVYDNVLVQTFLLEPNRSSEFPTFKIPNSLTGGNKVLVVASYLVENGATIARHVNFHEPLKEVPFPQSKQFSTKVCTVERRTWLELSSTVPMKGVLVEAQGDNTGEVVWEDNGIDLVPGEVTKLYGQGLRAEDERKLSVRWLGGSLELSTSSL